jgi:hypothetical protein
MSGSNGASSRGEGGPIGKGVADVRPGNPPILVTNEPHGLNDKERVRISTAGDNILCFVKVSGQSENTFSAHANSELTQPASLQGVARDDKIERLNADDWGVVAGINYYPGFTNLKGPVYDSTLFRRWLLRRGFVPDDQVFPIQSPENAPASILAAEPKLDQLSGVFSELVRKAAPHPLHRLGRRLYIFLSGHGIIATRSVIPDYREAALLMANADENSLSLHLGARAHAEWFRALGIFDEVILIADCCRDQEDNVPPAIPVLPAWQPKRPEGRHFYALPTMLGSKAWERTLGSPPTTRGIFSYVVIEALNNPKLYDEQGELPASTLERHLYTAVPELNGKQDPYIDYSHDPRKPEIILAKWFPGTRQKVQINFLPSCPGQVARLYRGNNIGKPLGSHSTDESWIDDWDAGWLYKIVIEGTDRKQLFEIVGSEEVQIVTV